MFVKSQEITDSMDITIFYQFMSMLIDDMNKENKRILDGKTINIRQNKIHAR